MKIINVVVFANTTFDGKVFNFDGQPFNNPRENHVTFVVTVGALGNDVSVYWEANADDPKKIAQNGNKITKQIFDKLASILMSGLIYDIPDGWYYRS